MSFVIVGVNVLVTLASIAIFKNYCVEFQMWLVSANVIQTILALIYLLSYTLLSRTAIVHVVWAAPQPLCVAAAADDDSSSSPPRNLHPTSPPPSSSPSSPSLARGRSRQQLDAQSHPNACASRPLGTKRPCLDLRGCLDLGSCRKSKVLVDIGTAAALRMSWNLVIAVYR